MSSYHRRLGLLPCVAVLMAACARDAALPPPTDKPDKDSQGGGKVTAPPGKGAVSDGPGDGSEALPEIARSTRSSLQWKRHAAFEADLAQALDLPPEELCNEFGKDSCIRGVHLSPLGGHNPFTTGLLESPLEPLVTTSTVMERVVLSACLARIEKDRALGSSGVVFGALALDAPAPAPEDEVTRTVINTLYQRLLSRDAEPYELETLAALTRDEQGKAVDGASFAASACMAIGTTSEFLFF